MIDRSAVEAVEGLGRCDSRQRDEGGERHEFPVARADEGVREIARRLARSSGRPRMMTGYSSPRLTKVEISVSPNINSSVRPMSCDRHVEIGRALPVDLHADVGLRFPVVGIHVDEHARGLRLLHDDVAPFAQGRRSRARRARTGSSALTPRWPSEAGLIGMTRAPGQLRDLGVHLLHDLVLLDVALVPGDEAHDDRCPR